MSDSWVFTKALREMAAKLEAEQLILEGKRDGFVEGLTQFAADEKLFMLDLGPHEQAMIAVLISGGMQRLGGPYAKVVLEYARVHRKLDKLARCGQIADEKLAPLLRLLDPTPKTAHDIEGKSLQEMARSAASFMVMQTRWIQTMAPDRPNFDGPTAAAFAYGVWDSITQQMNLNDDEFLDSLALFASRWLDTHDEKTIDETTNAMLCFGDDATYHQSVVAGGKAFRTWLSDEPKGDFFPVHLGQCMALVPRKTKTE